MKRVNPLIVMLGLALTVTTSQAGTGTPHYRFGTKPDTTTITDTPRTGVGRLLTRPDSESLLQTTKNADPLYIGAVDPDEVLIIDTDTAINQDIILLNSGTLRITDAHVDLSGDIIMLNQSSFEVQSAELNIAQDFAYQYQLTATQNSILDWRDVVFTSRGSWSCGVVEQVQVQFENVVADPGFITWGFFDDSAGSFVDCATAGEFLPMGSGTLTFERVDFLLLWLNLRENIQLQAELPDDNPLGFWEITPGSPFGINIPYTVTITDCSAVNWAVMAESGSEAKFTNSHLRVAGTIFDRSNEVQIQSICNQARIADSSYTWGDVNLRFENTLVDTWNFYCFGDTSLKMDRCLFGELLTEHRGRAEVLFSFCDSSGGYIGAFGDSILYFLLSSTVSQVTARDNALFLIGTSAVLSSQVDVTDNAGMALINSTYRGEPAAFDAGFLVDANLEPTEGFTNRLVPIKGTARSLSGPENEGVFPGYRLYYGAGSQPSSWTMIGEFQTSEVRTGVLGQWDTTGLTPGAYALRMLVGTVDSPEPIEVLSSGFLKFAEPVQKSALHLR